MFILIFSEYGLEAKPSMYKSAFWPSAGMIMVMMIIVRARNYN